MSDDIKLRVHPDEKTCDAALDAFMEKVKAARDECGLVDVLVVGSGLYADHVKGTEILYTVQSSGNPKGLLEVAKLGVKRLLKNREAEE